MSGHTCNVNQEQMQSKLFAVLGYKVESHFNLSQSYVLFFPRAAHAGDGFRVFDDSC